MRYLYLIIVLLGFPTLLLATHNRAGEIIVRAEGDCSDINSQLRACATIITYTEVEQTDVDREELLISWGDGTTDTIRRDREILLGNGIKRNEYTLCHRFPGFGRYFISFQDQNRVANIVNIDGGGSVNIPFSVYTVYTLANPILNGCNSSPELTQSPIENACIGSVWTHNPGAFDIDGDSLAFEFTTPQRAPGVPIANYSPVNAGTGALSINEETGQITWDAPAIAGEYTLAFLVKSFRNGIPLDTLVRDMQIFVAECANDPPEVELPFEEICVVAGEVIQFDVVATAPLTDTEQEVKLTASGRPFDFPENMATFTPSDSIWRPDPEVKSFRWETTCAHISNQPYFVVFRAEDDFFSPTSGLSTVRVVSIKVVAPPPEGLRAVADDDFVTITWDKPYTCEDSEDPLFLGFTVWRREGSNPFTPDTCQTGLAGRGYTQITPRETQEMQDGRYVFVDDQIERGKTYCYRVVALLGRPIINLGLIFEEIESIPSREVCVQLARDIPLLTKVDVTSTDNANGSIDVCWIRPSPLALDTLQNSGPYRYVLSRAEGLTTDAAAFTEIASFERQFFGQEIDTCFTDTGLDTEGQAYAYRIELFVEDENAPIGEGQAATSVRLSGSPTDNANDLSWTSITPWTNISYDVFRQAPGSPDFVFLTNTTAAEFRDEDLENGAEYCYFVRAEGTYSVEDIPSPLINRSQELCLRPLDNVPPCPPSLEVISVCDRGVDCTDADNLFNTLNWVSPEEICGADDIAGYRIYFSSDSAGTPAQVAEILDAETLTFDHFPDNGITGCYTITAFDVIGNESAPSAEVCVTNCPIYDLPNAFTPNGDGQNDRFIPRGRCFVERIEFQVFNRWGQLVFETQNPAIEWDGSNLAGEKLPSGTYHYVARIFEQRLEGVTVSAEPLSGFIELFAGEGD